MRPVLHVVTDSGRTYHRLIERLQALEHARVIELDSDSGSGITPKTQIVRRLLSPRLLGLRKAWHSDEVVLVIGWYLVPILALMRIHVLPRPRRVIGMAAFVHSPWVRVAINRFLRLTTIPELEFIVFDNDERRSLMEDVGLPPARVHKVTYRSRLDPEVEVADDGPAYVFTGGYSNRDYATFFGAVETLPYNVIAVPSSLNRLEHVPANVEVRRDVPWTEFELLLAASTVLVLPLRATGEASGQNVLMRGMRYERPVIATRHVALIDYLGERYPGFVAPGDAPGMRDAIQKAMSEEGFRRTLIDEVARRRAILIEQPDTADEIIEILEAPAAELANR